MPSPSRAPNNVPLASAGQLRRSSASVAEAARIDLVDDGLLPHARQPGRNGYENREA